MTVLCTLGLREEEEGAGGECSVRSQRPQLLSVPNSHPPGGISRLSVSRSGRHSFISMYSTRHTPCLKELRVSWERKACPRGSHTALNAVERLGESGSSGEQAHHLPFITGRGSSIAHCQPGPGARSTILSRRSDDTPGIAGQPLSGFFIADGPSQQEGARKYTSPISLCFLLPF